MPKRPSAHALATLREAMAEHVQHAVAAVGDAGEAVVARIVAHDGEGPTHFDDGDDVADVMVDYEDPATEHPGRAMLFIPGNVLFSMPEKDDSALVVRPRNARGPGAAYLFHGDAGTKDRVPSWIRAKVGLFTKKLLRLESSVDAVEVLANGGGSDLRLNVPDGGETAGVARVGDTVDCGTLYVVTGTTGVTALAYLGPGVTLPTPPPGTAIALTGKITSGAPHVLAPKP